jgi:hypothetical protein
MSPKRITRPLDIYVRVSDVRGRAGDSFISPRDQEERCRALAKARGYKVGDVFTDLDVSGGKMRRPEFDKAIARIDEGVSGGIIVAKLDRFARTLVGGLQTLEQINELGGAVIVADGEFDTATATGELVLNMMLSLAQFELRRIRERGRARSVTLSTTESTSPATFRPAMRAARTASLSRTPDTARRSKKRSPWPHAATPTRGSPAT